MTLKIERSSSGNKLAAMKTFCVETLGCKINFYESHQLRALLKNRGLIETDEADADLCIVNTCSVTGAAARQSRQTARRLGRGAARVVVTGCWATDAPAAAAALNGVHAVITHHDDVAAKLNQLLDQWLTETSAEPIQQPGDGGIKRPDFPPVQTDKEITAIAPVSVNKQSGTHQLPLLTDRQSDRQRAVLKIQDGCDASCTYCIIPRLRPALWSKSAAETVAEARALVAAGHVEIVLTGIFLGAFGQPTALRRHQPTNGAAPLADLVNALCTSVGGLRRLRLSSIEPGDLTEDLLAALRSHAQVVPHFHLPLQSGSDAMLRRMNRQYRRDDFRRLIDRIKQAFDRPALTTDVIVGFPGEGDDDFAETIELVREAEFIHVHAFPFSPRAGTAAARWTDQFVPREIIAARSQALRNLSETQSLAFRKQFIGETVEVIVEAGASDGLRHGRCERYFSVHFPAESAGPGDAVRVTVQEVLPERTVGTLTPPAADCAR
jgi:threonylcarbamoyladenosine tRNA methylthiotransferase MtaB